MARRHSALGNGYESAKSRCHKLWNVVDRADRAYTNAVHAVAGPRASRWTLTPVQKKHPRIVKAYKRKIAVDAAHWRACQVMRKRSP